VERKDALTPLQFNIETYIEIHCSQAFPCPSIFPKMRAHFPEDRRNGVKPESLQLAINEMLMMVLPRLEI
jgi:hypothetical protein